MLSEVSVYLMVFVTANSLCPGSPFTCKITDSSQVVVSGQSLKMSPLSRAAVFTVDPRGVTVNECVVTGERGTLWNSRVRMEWNGTEWGGEARWTLVGGARWVGISRIDSKRCFW